MVALIRPLRLKAEVAKAKAEGSSSSFPIARVWVDSSVYHLDSEYDYLIPDNLSDFVCTGVRVQVPFHGREVEALVLSRETTSEIAQLKPITKVLSSHSVATTESIALIARVSKRWAAHPFDVVRSAIPPRVASVDREEFTLDRNQSHPVGKSQRVYLHIPPAINRFAYIADAIRKYATQGSTLVIVPDTRSAGHLQRLFPEALSLDSADDRSERYRNFLRIRNERNLLVIGTRSAIFAPLSDLASIVIVDETSEQYFEPRSPGWNVRDVAILRAMNTTASLYFIGYSPSAEAARLIENNWMQYSSSRTRLVVDSFPQSFGELIPSRLISLIRKSMKNGPILFLSPRKGYSQAITCSKCRNIALCSCGGKLSQSSSQSTIACVMCARTVPEFRCSWCQGTTPYLLGRGADRFAYEIGAAFPGTAITQSSAENMLDEYDHSSGFVIATPGSAPITTHGYAQVVILEGDRFFSQADLRAQERTRELFFSVAALAAPKAPISLVISSDNPVIGAIAAWKPSLVSQRELREREEVNLPPFTRAITMDVAHSESQSLLRGLKKSQEDGRLPSSTSMLGPSVLKGDVDRIVLVTPLVDAENVVELLHEFQRKRSASKKALASIRIDPYSLSR